LNVVAHFDAEALLDGRRSAVLIPATPNDRIRLAADGARQRLDAIPVGAKVYEVVHFGFEFSQVGATMAMRSLRTDRRYALTVTGIHLVNCAELTPDELAALGHASRASFDGEWGEVLDDRLAWFIHLIPLSTTARTL
jgi:hypothetical protein